MEPTGNMKHPANTFLLLQYNKNWPPWQPKLLCINKQQPILLI